jgi:hypothetical protein
MKWIRFSGIGYVPMAGFCSSGSEPLIPMKRLNMALIGVSVIHWIYIPEIP